MRKWLAWRKEEDARTILEAMQQTFYLAALTSIEPDDYEPSHELVPCAPPAEPAIRQKPLACARARNVRDSGHFCLPADQAVASRLGTIGGSLPRIMPC